MHDLFRLAALSAGNTQGGVSFAITDLSWVKVRPTAGASTKIAHASASNCFSSAGTLM